MAVADSDSSSTVKIELKEGKTLPKLFPFIQGPQTRFPLKNCLFITFLFALLNFDLTILLLEALVDS